MLHKPSSNALRIPRNCRAWLLAKRSRQRRAKSREHPRFQPIWLMPTSAASKILARRATAWGQWV